MEAVAWKEDFTLSPRGIREPVGEPFSGKIDVAVLPLLAVDERGVRLGYGGGCYDRFLAAHPETFPLAYCFDFQIVREVARGAVRPPRRAHRLGQADSCSRREIFGFRGQIRGQMRSERKVKNSRLPSAGSPGPDGAGETQRREKSNQG